MCVLVYEAQTKKAHYYRFVLFDWLNKFFMRKRGPTTHHEAENAHLRGAAVVELHSPLLHLL